MRSKLAVSRKKYDRSTVVREAMDIFWRRGYQGTTMAELCSATGLNRKSLYAEFGDKSVLFAESLSLYISIGVAQSRAILRRKPLGIDNVRDYFRAMRYGSDCCGCLMTMTVNEQALVPKGSLKEVADAVHEIERLLRNNLRADGYDRVPARRLATFFVFSIQGITTMGKLEGDDRRLAQVVETILGVLDEST